MADIGVGETFADYILHFVVYLNRHHFSVGGHSFGKAEGGIAGKRAEFEHPRGANHPREHFDEAALQMVGTHPRIGARQACGAVKPVEVFGLGVDVGRYIVVEDVGRHFLALIMWSIPRR